MKYLTSLDYPTLDATEIEHLREQIAINNNSSIGGQTELILKLHRCGNAHEEGR